MGISVKLSGGVTLAGVLCIIGSILLEYAENIPDKYWKLFYAGIGITALGVFLVVKGGGDSN
ncbi:MAG: hypothetical protein EPO37_00245 [Nitrosarchaeum sp.]|nr:MAG: hypothetical protein EPO37_00245 [Nitrosarchaeum sp.]